MSEAMWRLLLADAGAPLYVFPWTVSILLLENRDMKYMSVVYGILVSVTILGRYIGSMYPLDTKGDQGTVVPVARTQCTILFFAFLLLSASSRLLVVFLCYFSIGFASSSLGVLIRNHKNYLHKRYRQRADNLSVEQEVLRMNILSFIFCTLFSGICFNENTDSLLPGFFACLVAAIYFLFLLGKSAIKDLMKLPIFAKLTRGRIMESIDGSSVNLSGAPTSSDIVEIDIDEADVEPSDIYIQAFKNDIAAAKKAYITRLKWRKLYNVDQVLSAPQKFFDEILENYPHAIHGRSKEGCAIVYECIGQGDPRKLISLGVSPEILLWHFNMRNEYIFRRLSKSSFGPLDEDANSDPVTHLMTVIDVKGIGMSDFTADVLSFLKQSSDTIESYYPPGTVIRLVIVNAPYWFSSVWSMVAKVLPDSVNKKVIIARGMNELDKFIDPDQV